MIEFLFIYQIFRIFDRIKLMSVRDKTIFYQYSNRTQKCTQSVLFGMFF